jgi:hypothetical protein
MQANARAGGPSEMRPVREWGLDPMCFAHVRLLAFDLLSLRPVPNLQGKSFSFVPIIILLYNFWELAWSATIKFQPTTIA